MINMTDLGVKGAAFPCKFTPDPFVFVPLSMGNGEQLDLNSTNRAILDMYLWHPPARFLSCHLRIENALQRK